MRERARVARTRGGRARRLSDARALAWRKVGVVELGRRGCEILGGRRAKRAGRVVTQHEDVAVRVLREETGIQKENEREKRRIRAHARASRSRPKTAKESSVAGVCWGV